MTVTIENTYTGNNSKKIYPFTFPYLDQTDVKVSLDGTELTNSQLFTKGTTSITFKNDTGSATSTQAADGSPKTGVAVRLYRSTAYNSPKATFYPGSAIRAGDLNDNALQNLYVTQEANNDITLSWKSGDPTVVSSETWYTTDDTKIATSKAIENRIDTKMTEIAVSKLADGDARQLLQTAANGNDVEWTSNVDIPGTLDVTGAVTFDSSVTATTFTGNLSGNANTATDLAAAAKITNSEQAAHSVNDTSYFTTSACDARYFNISTGDTIKDGDTFPDNDTTIATTAAINDRIIDLVDEVGGFLPIANETSFPTANPDPENGTGTIVSIQALASNLTSNGSGVATIANAAGSGVTVTINGLANSTTYAATFGMLVETTAVTHTYKFHRQTPKATEVTTVASNVSNVNTVASNISAITTTSNNIGSITTVNNNAPNINAVAGQLLFSEDLGLITASLTTGSGNDINTVANAITNINTVAGIDANITTVAGISSNVTTVAGIASDVTAVAADATDIGAVAGKATEIGRLGTVAAVADLAILGTTDVVSDLNTLATTAIVADMDTLADISSNITTVAGISANVTTVAGISSNVTSVAGNNSNITAVAGNATNINSAVSNASNINTVAGSIADVNRYANEYTIASSTPGSPSEGDLWYDSTNNLLKYHNGSSFVGITSGLTAILQDTSPALGGNLDCNDRNLTEVGTVSGDNLQMDFGTLS